MTDLNAVLNDLHVRLERAYRDSRWFDPTLSFTMHWMKNPKTKVAGRAFYADNRIELNQLIYQKNKEEFWPTVVHELCHLLQRRHYPNAKQAHGPEFKSIMRSFGVQPSTYHNYDIKGVARRRTKHKYVVDGTEFLLSPQKHRKVLLGTRYFHPKTRTVLSPALHYRGQVTV